MSVSTVYKVVWLDSSEGFLILDKILGRLTLSLQSIIDAWLYSFS